jgi:hypothetical protein
MVDVRHIPESDRRKRANRLNRITRDAELQEEKKVDHWVRLGEDALSRPIKHKKNKEKEADADAGRKMA